MHLTKKSYTKQSELKYKEFVPTNSFGKEFGDTGTNNLSQLGKKIIETFINDNKEKLQKLKEKEEEIYRIKHSKPPLQLNPWKPYNKIKGEFGQYPIDQVHSFRKERKKKFLIEEPFRIPKKDGEYFEKIVKVI